MSRTIKKAYTGSKRFDVTCRNHGSCSYCKNNRTFSSERAKLLYNDTMIEHPELSYQDYKDNLDLRPTQRLKLLRDHYD